MKKILSLLAIVMLFTMAGCLNDSKTKKQTGTEKLKALAAAAENEKRATVVTNGIYVTGATTTAGTVTVLYTFVQFMDLADDAKNTIFANPKAFIVYKDKYIDMVSFLGPTVSATSFTNGTDGVKPIVDDSVIAANVVTPTGANTVSGTAALKPIPSILQSLTSGASSFADSNFTVRAVFNKAFTLTANDITIVGAKTAVTVSAVTMINDNAYDITIGSVKDFSAEYTITVKGVDKQEATKVFPYTKLQLNVLDKFNTTSSMITVAQWMTAYNTPANATYIENLTTRVLATPGLKDETSRSAIYCLEGNGKAQYYISAWIEDSKGKTLTNNIEVTFQTIYGSLAKPSDTFTVVDGYATNKLLSMQNTDVVLDKIKVRVTKTPEDATGYLGRESDYLQIAYMPSPTSVITNVTTTSSLSIDLRIIKVENTNIADRVVIGFDRQLTATTATLGVDLFKYLNDKNFKNTLKIRDNIRNRTYNIVQWYKLPEDPSKLMAILDYNLVDAGAATVNGTQMLTDNAKHSLIVTRTEYKNDTVTVPGVNMNVYIEATTDAFVETAAGVTPVVRSLDFQLKDDVSLGYIQIYTETYRQRVLKGETPTALEKINMLVTTEPELAIYVQYSESVAFDAINGIVSGYLNGITTREGYANNLSNYTVNGRMLTKDVVLNVELIEGNPLVLDANKKDVDWHSRNTVKITLDKKIVTQLGYNFKYGPNNAPVSTTSAVNWSTTKENLFATAKTGDWAAINNDKANILDSEMKDNFKVNIITNELPPAAVIVYVGNNNPEIWSPKNVKSYAAPALSPNLAVLDAADNFSPEQFVIKFTGDVYANVNDLNTILKLKYFNRATAYPQSKIKMTAYKWNDFTVPITDPDTTKVVPVADITKGFNAILVELDDWSTVITQPSMYYHNFYKEIQFTIPEKTVYIVDMIQGQKTNAVINLDVTLRQDWASPRVVTVASFDPTKNKAAAAYRPTAVDVYPADVRFDELKTKKIIIQNVANQFLLKSSEPIQVADAIIKEDETLAQKWYQKTETVATTAKPRAAFTNPLTDENEVRFEFYNEAANVTYFGRVVRATMNEEDTMWRIQPCTTTGTATVVSTTESTIAIQDIDLAQVLPNITFNGTRADGKTKYATWRLAIKKIADDAGNSMDTLEWIIEIEKVDTYTPIITTDVKHKVAVDQDSPRIVWAKMVRDVNIKVGDNFLTTSAIFVKFSHVMQDNTTNGVGVLSGYQLDKYRFSQKAQMIRGIYFTNNVGTGVTVTENWDGATIVLPTNEDYDNNYGVHTLDVPNLTDIYGRTLQGITELDLQPITTAPLNVNILNSLDEDNDGLQEKVSMWVNPYNNYDELNNELTGNDYSRVDKNRDNTTLRDVDIMGGMTYITGAKLYWDINAPYAKEINTLTDPKNRTYVITKYDELKSDAPNLTDAMNVIGEFTTKGGDQPDVAGVTSLDFTGTQLTTYTYDNTKRIQIWLAVAKADTTTTAANGDKTTVTDFRHILLSDLPVNATTVWNPAAVTATTTAAVGANTVTINGFTTAGATVTLLSGGGAAVPVTADAVTGAYSLVVTGLTTNTTYTFVVQSAILGYTGTATIMATTSNVVIPSVAITSATASNVTQTTATLTVEATTGATIVVTGATAGAAAEVNGTYTIALTGLTAGTVYNAITVTASKAGFTTSAAFTVTSFTTPTMPTVVVTSAVAGAITTTTATITVVSATTGATIVVAGATAGVVTEVAGTYTIPVTGLTANTTYAGITVTASKAGNITSAAFTVTTFKTTTALTLSNRRANPLIAILNNVDIALGTAMPATVDKIEFYNQSAVLRDTVTIAGGVLSKTTVSIGASDTTITIKAYQGATEVTTTVLPNSFNP